MRSALVLLISLAIQGALYYYLWRRLVLDTQVEHRWRKRLTTALVILAPSVPLTLGARRVSASVGQIVGWPVFFCMAAAGLTVTFLFMVDSARLAAWATHWIAKRAAPAPMSPQRRAFMRRVTGGGAALSALAGVGLGAYEALKTPRVLDRRIHLARLPKSLHGLRIVQLTDIHIGNTIGKSFVRSVVDATNAAKPDLIVITGDLVDGPVEQLREEAEPLADLSAPYGVFFVTGNHEYYSGVDAWISFLGEIGIRVLRNERVRIGKGEDYFDLAGIDDYRAYRYAGHGPDLAKALQGRDPSKELILLAHQPRHIHQARQHRVGLQLSGHTHGGQIWPWHYIAKASQGGLLAGHSHHEETQLYISRGTGYWGPPVRLFATSEITRITLGAGTVSS